MNSEWFYIFDPWRGGTANWLFIFRPRQGLETKVRKDGIRARLRVITEPGRDAVQPGRILLRPTWAPDFQFQIAKFKSAPHHARRTGKH